MWFSYILLLISIRDTILVMTITLKSNVWRFISQILDFSNLPMEDVSKEDCQDMEEHWETYRMVRDIAKDTNWTFGTLMKILHVGNELFLVNFMKYCLKKHTPSAVILWMLFTIVKFLFAYASAAIIHQYVRQSALFAKHIYCHQIYDNILLFDRTQYVKTGS